MKYLVGWLLLVGSIVAVGLSPDLGRAAERLLWGLVRDVSRLFR